MEVQRRIKVLALFSLRNGFQFKSARPGRNDAQKPREQICGLLEQIYARGFTYLIHWILKRSFEKSGVCASCPSSQLHRKQRAGGSQFQASSGKEVGKTPSQWKKLGLMVHACHPNSMGQHK
jgi:hypothetical protein